MDWIKNTKFAFQVLLLLALFFNIGSTIHFFMPGHEIDFQGISHLFYSGMISVTLLFGLIPIYEKSNRYYGVEDHYFKTSLMLIGLSLLFHTINLLIGLPSFFFLLGALFGLIVFGIDVILLYFHFTDPDKTSVSYFYTSDWKKDFQK